MATDVSFDAIGSITSPHPIRLQLYMGIGELYEFLRQLSEFRRTLKGDGYKYIFESQEQVGHAWVIVLTAIPTQFAQLLSSKTELPVM